MKSFRLRSEQKELLDADGIPAADLHRNLYELEVINKLLGGHKATFLGLNKIIKDKNRTWRIIDLGCGGGDTLRAIYYWAQKKGVKVTLTGVDLLEEAVGYSREHSDGLPIEYIQSDFADVATGSFDIAISSLFCHHLYDDTLKGLVDAKLRLADHLLINDLHRHFLAYHSIKWLTVLFSKSYLVKNDAPLSVARGFKRSDLKVLLSKSEASTFEIHWSWAFRWVVIGKR